MSKVNGLGERERKVNKKMSKGNVVGERERKVSKKKGAKEIDWEKGTGR